MPPEYSPPPPPPQDIGGMLPNRNRIIMAGGIAHRHQGIVVRLIGSWAHTRGQEPRSDVSPEHRLQRCLGVDPGLSAMKKPSWTAEDHNDQLTGRV